MSPEQKIIHQITTSAAPAAVAAYSQGLLIQRGDYREVVTSGQIALHPDTNQLIEGGIVPQTERVLKSVGAILAAGGAEPGDVYQTDVVVTDSADFAAFNGVYQEWDWIEGVTLPTRFTSVGGLLIPGSVVEVRAHAAYKVSIFRTIIDLKRGK